ncbi:hypothetical protein PV327_005368 [Microctonus hyperodae]|uniref:SWIM-type domain-containing protein n=1 Tax=Microctonus hyperodae TaxID=165561 RepID=A0AA39G218_MICHY|nr:hypothetical protein PV327_005368 [Microctonus hyperodae]
MTSVEFSIYDICSFTNTTPVSKAFYDGVELFRDGHIVCVEEALESSNEDNNLEIHACCMEDLESDYAPYKIEIQVNKEGKLCKAECSCETGYEVQSCKHIIGLLLYCNWRPNEESQLIHPHPVLNHENLPTERSRTNGNSTNVPIVDNVTEPLRMGKVSMDYLPDRRFENSLIGVLGPYENRQ